MGLWDMECLPAPEVPRSRLIRLLGESVHVWG